MLLISIAVNNLNARSELIDLKITNLFIYFAVTMVT